MSLLDVDTIDYVGVNILFKRVYVGIFDDLDWDDEATHFSLLTKKIDRYTQYVRSGQLLAAYPRVRGYPVIIEYVAMRPMTRTAEAFWKTRETIIRAVGFDVRCRTVDVRHATAPDSVVADVVGTTNVKSGVLVDTRLESVADVLDLAMPPAAETRHSNEIVRVDHHPILVMHKKTSSGR
ncbi:MULTISPECIES: DUF6572 domain-containing protein [Burkholderiaceae]|jgi:hypothetical protein|uniref:Uncharacterized protein n=1 Tax=Caballeronia sordidicola TaxID=196367 RepID=A0A242N4T0_CABSO|nr:MULTISPECIES: DUF6572 domain-containing protein [Burkholderiaceae]MDP9157126.1 hypothetical protein [Pseudomonadota bacterium]AME26412.1 hypothetical protein AXG89_21295 [Burkholderia sp. PAMC 26561]AMM17251.1 hypothetical protein AX768_23740 [Burkholderia sp. PAMC 28687]OTP75262.1 hypothetical protein PAMC26510_15075 [Caballeronia sordidicola]OTP78661.1 hypothetical protein PAMC26577_03480 [Caballeronia sordidicola]